MRYLPSPPTTALCHLFVSTAAISSPAVHALAPTGGAVGTLSLPMFAYPVRYREEEYNHEGHGHERETPRQLFNRYVPVTVPALTQDNHTRVQPVAALYDPA